MSETRRYRLIGCLGEGGFGRVYRARLEGAQGFVKDVAIKRLHDADAPAATIARFRDEARILGLVRDRAIVGVDPPVQLDGSWALVMEYVDGASCRALLRMGPIPPRAALEIAAEVARALDAVWQHPGPDGEPLQLLHRDLKPANLQITPTGQVKILDLGIARARFDGREAATTMHLAGTPGYMAPERLRGQEGPQGDVFSLGVVLHELVTGVRPSEHGAEPTFELDAGTAPPDAVIDLARQMRSPRPEDRPTAREVETRCLRAMAEQTGPTLREWAEANVPSEPFYLDDPHVGSVLTEWRPEPVSSRSANRAIAVVVLTLGAIGAAALTVLASAPPSLEQALRQPFADFVMETNAAASERSDLRDPANWDTVLFQATRSRLEDLAADPGSWRRIDRVWTTWRDVVLTLRQAGLPEVVAGIPWIESRYTPELQSTWCAKGLWQLMPEVAVRSNRLHGVPIEVRDCTFADSGELWTPTLLAPPHDKPYLKDGQCRIPKRRGCAVDGRTDVELSTRATMALLQGAWTDPDLRASGGIVQLTLASHYAGYDDAAFDQPRKSNVKPAFAEWAARTPDDRHPSFLSASDTSLSREAADLVAGALAAQFAAVCYYGQNYPDEPAFRDWAKYADGYCRALDVPDRSEVAF